MPFGVVAGSGSAAGAGLGDAAPGEEKGVEGTIGDGEASEDAAGVGDWDGDGVGDVVVDGKASGDGLGDGNACRAEAGDGKASGDGLGDGKACGAGAGDGKASGDGDALDVLAGTMAGDAAAAGEAVDEPAARLRTLSVQLDSICATIHSDVAAMICTKRQQAHAECL